jgi:DNA polymerase I-like protein with 3'-5' exonuclease and polymerase domains
LKPWDYSKTAIDLEHEVATLCFKIEQNGWPFDVRKATELYSRLAQRREELKVELQGLFDPWEEVDRVVTYKRDNKKLEVKAGDTRTYYKTVVFNPGSRQHIQRCLETKYGWKPEVFTPSGQAKIDEETLKRLEYPEAKKLAEWFLVEKRIGQLAEGDQAWLKLERNGKVHGSYNTNGAVTGRATHSNPNIAQVPSGSAEYGRECRELFGCPPGWKLVGADYSGLELRCLAHYMATFDNGAYGREVVEGDVHTANQKAAGLPTRNNAKTFIYAFL